MTRHANLEAYLTLSPRTQAGLFFYSTQGSPTPGHQKISLKWDWLSTYGEPQLWDLSYSNLNQVVK